MDGMPEHVVVDHCPLFDGTQLDGLIDDRVTEGLVVECERWVACCTK